MISFDCCEQAFIRSISKRIDKRSVCVYVAMEVRKATNNEHVRLSHDERTIGRSIRGWCELKRLEHIQRQYTFTHSPMYTKIVQNQKMKKQKWNSWFDSCVRIHFRRIMLALFSRCRLSWKNANTVFIVWCILMFDSNRLPVGLLECAHSWIANNCKLCESISVHWFPVGWWRVEQQQKKVIISFTNIEHTEHACCVYEWKHNWF